MAARGLSRGMAVAGFFLALRGVVGVVADLLGIGGGGIMVPSLTALFVAQGFASEHVGHLALATSMAAIVPTSIASLRAHHVKDTVIWRVVRDITPSILLGTFAATFIAAYLSSTVLAIFFACFMGYVALQTWLGIKPPANRELPCLT